MKKIYTLISIFILVSAGCLVNAQAVEFSPSAKGDDLGRGTLTIGIDENQNADGIKVYAYNSSIYIITNAIDADAKVVVYDVTGKVAYSGTLQNSGRNSINLPDKSGVYFVKVYVENDVYTEKIYLSK